ncbi:hypothetical protein NDU88_007519 [Pleurodeles waltl]|uniref:Uncharacterized protein n=1 Tax=Pleurodeles waltl TaxID=8319 RepID=A0AAV7LVP4_PLEWA|nr:hypothetical protein NDU88_007519 [Pleurodeles waltl]
MQWRTSRQLMLVSPRTCETVLRKPRAPTAALGRGQRCAQRVSATREGAPDIQSPVRTEDKERGQVNQEGQDNPCH